VAGQGAVTGPGAAIGRRLSCPSPDRQIVVSVHDVCPARSSEIVWLLERLDALGARPRVLKVIPASPDGPLLDYPAFVDLLRAEAAAGSEIVQHGYTHRASGPPRGPLLTRTLGWLFARQAAELLSLDAEALTARLAAGQRILRAAGLEVRGFCAPGWLAPPDLLGLLRRLGFRYYIGMSALIELEPIRRRWLPWFGYIGADPIQEHLVGLGGRLFLAVGARAPAVKVFLHPQDAPASAACRTTLDCLARLLRERRPTTYASLLGL